MTTTLRGSVAPAGAIRDGSPRAHFALGTRLERTISGVGVRTALCMLILLIAGVAGGGQGGLGDVLAQQLSFLLLALLAWEGYRQRLAWRAPGWVRALPALAVALPLLQLLPIPISMWSWGPARSELAGQLAQVGVSAIHVISLNPSATKASLLSMAPAIAVFLAALTLPRRPQVAMLVLVGLLALGDVLMGMAQLGEGRGSALRLYENTNHDQAVGFFANRNHLAGFLAMCIPAVIGTTSWALVERIEGRRLSPLWIVAGCGLLVLLILGIAMTSSRAGLLLGMLAVLGSLAIMTRTRRRHGGKRVLVLTIGIAVVLAIQLSLIGVLQRLDSDPLEDGRWQYGQVTRAAAAEYAPLGSGLGTFRQAYQPFEARSRPSNVIINHAHNDYLELWLEGGVAALLLMALGAAAWAYRSYRLWRPSADPEEAGTWPVILSRAAWLAVTLALVHSALDYPLRTTASMSVFALFAAIAFSARSARGAHHPRA